MDSITTPTSTTETVVEVLSGPKWNGGLRRWEWTFFTYWWNLSPAYCGKCGECTTRACGHPEAERHVRGQIFVTCLEQTEKYWHEAGYTVRYVRHGRTIGTTEAKATS